jgi:hypothetical protein
MRDDRFDAGLNANLDIGFVIFKISFVILVPKTATPGIKVITKLNVAHKAPQSSSHYWPLCLRL